LVQNPEDLETLARLRVPARRLHLLGNGVDLGRFGGGDGGAVAGGSGRGEGDRVRDRVRAEVGAGPETVVVLAVGRLVREKGYVELFAAARELRQRRAGVKVVVAGPEEPSKSDGLSPADLALAREAGVVLLGYRPDVEDLYAAADIYVLASHREGFPRSAMEAAAMGLPIVATDIRGCRQVVDDGETGILFPAGDAGALASAIERLATDAPLRTAMAARAVVKAADEFDQQRVIDLTLRLYGELLGRAGRGSIR
jgi:glycosyltransferase involved in cell wall biosynthesis